MKFRSGMYLLVATMVLTSCKGKEKPSAEGESAPATGQTESAAAPAPVGGATISGTIKFTGAKPASKKIAMSADPYCKGAHTETVMDEEVVVNPNGTLRYVYVYVKSGLPAGQTFPASSEPAVLDQHGCMYVPHVVAVQAGQPLTVLNSDPVLHNVNARPKDNQGFNFGQPVQNMKSTKSFTKAEVMIPVKCDVHPWMHSYIGVQTHPFAAVSTEDGSFTLKGLPAGTYEIEAWHEKYKTMTQSVTVGENETKSITFTFKG